MKNLLHMRNIDNECFYVSDESEEEEEAPQQQTLEKQSKNTGENGK